MLGYMVMSNGKGETVSVNCLPMAGADRLDLSRLELFGELTIRHVAIKLRGMLGSKEPLHIFLVQGFAPSPENTLHDLFAAYATDRGGDKELVLKYSHQIVHG